MRQSRCERAFHSALPRANESRSSSREMESAIFSNSSCAFASVFSSGPRVTASIDIAKISAFVPSRSR